MKKTDPTKTAPTLITAASTREEKDRALRDDVRMLGAMLGNILVEQEGAEAYERVEAIRKVSIARRAGDDPAAEDVLAAYLADVDVELAEVLTRAFSVYFQLVNLAERVHRIRRRRQRAAAGDDAQPGSLHATVAALKAKGWDRAAIEGLLKRTIVEPVFTAHPTEATRRTVLLKHQRIARALVDRLDPSRPPAEERAALGRIRAQVTTAWQTQELLSAKPQVADEVEHVLFYLTDIFYRIMPAFYETVEAALDEHFPSHSPGPISSVDGHAVIRFASWVGGDMDGNPNVDATTIAATLARHRALIIKRYAPEVHALAGEFSHSTTRVGVEGAVIRRGMLYADRYPEEMATIPRRYHDMPYRVLLRLMGRRLNSTMTDGDDRGYKSARGFLDDLKLIDRSLAKHKGGHAGRFLLQRLLRRVETFGFHLATLDVRQDALVHRLNVGELLGYEEPRWLALSATDRADRLRAVLTSGEMPKAAPSADARKTLDVFATIGACRRDFGTLAVGPYIISMAQTPEDVLAVMVLARWAGLVDDAGHVDLDIAPLFETVPDLRESRATMTSLLNAPLYRTHLKARGDRQVIMIGYSDSNKEGGLVASRWAIHSAQTELGALMDERDIHLTIFHGKGGTVSRGGGKTHRAILSEPRGAVNGALRLTEQGEVINAKYGLRGTAMRNMELTVGAVLTKTADFVAGPKPNGDTASRDAKRKRVLDALARYSREHYRALVYDHPDFVAYFRRATPIDAIERLRIGSRPASRRKGGGVENLRAIPWVFAWNQSRHMLPGWYGLGAGLRRVADELGDEALAQMAKDWPFFRTMLENVELVLAKTDMSIAGRYAELAGDVGERVFGIITEEHQRTRDWVLRLRGASSLLDGDPLARRSLQLRDPYVDPMSLLQVDLLKRWRAAGGEDEALEHALLITLNGIAHGLRATG